MKLATFRVTEDSREHFGVALDDHHLMSFTHLQQQAGRTHPELDNIYSYLNALPRSEHNARALLQWGQLHRDQLRSLHATRDVRFLPVVPKPRALLDFGLTPQHLKDSVGTMLRYEYGDIAGSLAAALVELRIDSLADAPILLYCKRNHCAVIGDGDTTRWPAHTSYLDIEPELAFVTGNERQPIAGYVIYNDFSARDSQQPGLMSGGTIRSKDFASGNGLGPYLVTTDAIADPRALTVSTRVFDESGAPRFIWNGSTAQYNRTPEQLLEFLRTLFTPSAGCVVGMGTIPGCTGLDNAAWLQPGDRIEIEIAGLGMLRQQIPARIPKLKKSRWPARPELERFQLENCPA